ncbi:MAG: hypothetical protein HOQ02_08195 [Lysobacter sp.]|nr:hypothetical protein [Lysobacter sp.]
MNDHDAFDNRLRAAHRAALASLSPQVRAQLAQRRRMALTTQASHARPALGWALAMLAVCAVAIGVFRPGSHDAAAPVLSASTPTTRATETLDDNPDFYLWLASRDADSLASE